MKKAKRKSKYELGEIEADEAKPGIFCVTDCDELVEVLEVEEHDEPGETTEIGFNGAIGYITYRHPTIWIKFGEPWTKVVIFKPTDLLTVAILPSEFMDELAAVTSHES